MITKSISATLLLLLLFSCSSTLSAQQISTNIFGHLNYVSENGNYKASLKEDIFNNLVFTDNQDNKVTFEKKYIDLEKPGLRAEKERKLAFFGGLVYQYSRESNYVAAFKVDIFDKVIVEDNRNNKVEYGTDIFGNPTYEETRGDRKSTLKTDILGNLVYQSGSDNAKLGKNIFDEWVYTDSAGNELKFSPFTWNKLKRRHRTEERVFSFLISSFLKS